MKIKKIKLKEIEQVMDIINDAKRLLAKDSLQWQQGYPNKEVMINDINNNDLFGLYINNLLVGIVALLIGKNPYYINIYEGKWDIPINDNDLVIHRIAVKETYHNKKIGDSLMKFADDFAIKNKCPSIKCDTHLKNIPMQYLLKNNGYQYKGIIILGRDEVDNSRIAFEKIIKQTK